MTVTVEPERIVISRTGEQDDSPGDEATKREDDGAAEEGASEESPEDG